MLSFNHHVKIDFWFLSDSLLMDESHHPPTFSKPNQLKVIHVYSMVIDSLHLLFFAGNPREKRCRAASTSNEARVLFRHAGRANV